MVECADCNSGLESATGNTESIAAQTATVEEIDEGERTDGDKSAIMIAETKAQIAASVREGDHILRVLVDIFCQGPAYNTTPTTYHYLGHALFNVSQIATARTHIMQRVGQGCVLQRLLPFTMYTESIIRRGGAIGCIRNCCFSSSGIPPPPLNPYMPIRHRILYSLCRYNSFKMSDCICDYNMSEDLSPGPMSSCVSDHAWLLGEEVDILPHLVLPLAGPEEIDDDEMDKLPDELQVRCGCRCHSLFLFVVFFDKKKTIGECYAEMVVYSTIEIVLMNSHSSRRKSICIFIQSRQQCP